MRKFLVILFFIMLTNLFGQNFVNTKGPYAGDVTAVISDNDFVLAGNDRGIYLLMNDSTWSHVLSVNTKIKKIYKTSWGTIFASGETDSYFESTDNGQSWNTAEKQFGTNVQTTVFAEDGYGNLYVGTSNKGMFKSADSGKTWVQTSFNGGRVNDIAFSPNGSFFVANDYSIAISYDNGITWDKIYIQSNKRYPTKFLKIDSSGKLYAIYNNLYEHLDNVYSSSNNGMTWKNISEKILEKYEYINDIRIDDNDDLFIAKSHTNSEGVYKYNVTQNIWERVFDIASLTLCLDDNGSIWIGSKAYGLFKKTLSINTYKNIGIIGDLDITTVVKRKDNTLFLNYRHLGGISRSSNGGYNWNFCGLRNADVTSIDFDLTNNIYCSVVNSYQSGNDVWSGVYLSSDNGKTWKNIMYSDGRYAKKVYGLHLLNDGSIIVARASDTGTEILKRGGDNKWTTQFQTRGWDFKFVTNKSDDIFIACDDGVLKSIDNGNIWLKRNTGLPNKYGAYYLYAIAVDSSENIYVSSRVTGNQGIYKSSDGGNSWIRVLGSISEPISIQSIHVTDNNTIVASGGGKIYYSNNQGVDWQIMNSELTEINVVFSNSLGDIILAGVKNLDYKREGVKILQKTVASPQLLSPQQGANLFKNSVLFKWDSTPNTNAYRFRLSNDELFTDVLIDTTITDLDLLSDEIPSENTTLWWSISPINIFGIGESSVSSFNIVNSTVILKSPNNFSLGLQQPISLLWNNIEMANNYHLQLSTNENFTSLVVDKTLLADTFYVLSELNNLSAYYWRVNASNESSQSDWSEVWNFKTLGEPTDISPLIPLANSTNQPIELNFVWSKAEDQLKAIKRNSVQSISNYWFELNTDTASSSVITDSTLSDTTKHISGLSNLTDYYWRVKAKNEAGWGSFSAWGKFTTIIDTPTVVVLQSPINNSNGNIKPIELKWNKSNLAETYWIQLSTVADFTTTLFDSVGITDTSFVVNNLYDFTKYYWRIKANNIGGESEWSNVWNFKTIGNPTESYPLFPLANSINQPIKLDFSWSKAKDQLKAIKGNRIFSISNYWFELNKDSSSVAIIVDSTLSDTTKHITNLVNSTTYFWRVRAKNETGWGNFSQWSKFTTVVDTPIVVTLKSPLNNSAKLQNPIGIVWNKSYRAENYKLQLSVNSDFSTTIIDSSEIVDTNLVVTKLENGTKYYWRIKANNIGGETEWSEVWNFSTLGEPTDGVQLYPIANAINQPIDVNFIWKKAKDKLSIIKGDNVLSVSNYWFELSNDTTKNSFIVDSTLVDTTKFVSDLTNQTSYYWKIKAKNELGWGNPSRWSKFTTIVDMPVVVTLKSPLNNDENVSKPISLIWNKSALAENYTLQVSLNSVFGSSVIDSSGITDTSFTVNNLDNSTKYFWRIKANNIGGESAWSEVWSFTTLGVPTAPTLILPENNLELADTTNSIKFVWNSVEFVDSYTLEASANENFDSLFVSINDLTDTNYIYSNQLVPGTFYWRVNAKNQAGIGDWSNIYSFTITLTDVDRLGNIIPQEYVLHQNYPNPFNPSTMVKYGLPEQSNIKIEIFNMLGQSVGVLVNAEKSAGLYETTWNADNLPSGIYLINIRAEGLSSKKSFVQVKKALLLK